MTKRIDWVKVAIGLTMLLCIVALIQSCHRKDKTQPVSAPVRFAGVPVRDDPPIDPETDPRRFLDPPPWQTNTFAATVFDLDGNILGRYGAGLDEDIGPLCRMIGFRYCGQDNTKGVDVQIWNYQRQSWWMPPGFPIPDQWDGKLRVQTIVRVGPWAD